VQQGRLANNRKRSNTMKTKTAAVTVTHKLGVARKIERSRVWLEGKRLVAHGFTQGTEYSTFMEGGKLVMVVGAVSMLGVTVRVVAGTKDRPIIDIVGVQIREAFGKGTHVSVEYTMGRIVVSEA
jgi:hypothetical protein